MQIFRLTYFYRFFYATTLAAVSVGLFVGIGLWGIVPAVLAVVVFVAFNRVQLRVAEDGVHYRGWRPGLGWHLSWDELWGVTVDTVALGANDGGTIRRLSFENKCGSPRRVRGFSERSCQAIIDAMRARGLTGTRDERYKG